MSTIWKEVLEMVPIQEIEIPQGAEILCAREQHEHACVWFRCDPNAPKAPRLIAMVGTGHGAPDADRYIGTCSLRGGHLILHVFEQTN